MNLRNVLRAYSLLRQLSDEESALLQTLRLTNETERALLVETLSDKPQKKSSKKSAGKGGKSRHASSLQQQIQGTATGKPHLGEGPVCGICAHTEDYEDHFKPSPHYHEFQPPATTAASGGGG